MAQREDLVAQIGDAPRVDAGRLVIFVDQTLQLGQRPVGFGAGQRRRQMIDDHRGRAPLGLAALARIVDDERVDVGQGTQSRLREAPLGQRQRLAGQPFEIAVLAHVHHGMRPEFFP